jgi:sugar lactone lactonase YvrE
LYWSDPLERTIRRSKVDGTFIELVASGESVGRVLGMALTEDGNTLYYTDANTGALLRINVSDVSGDEMTGKYDNHASTYPREIVLSGLSDPRGLVLDERHGTIYFVELTGRIYECNMDGSNMEVRKFSSFCHYLHF